MSIPATDSAIDVAYWFFERSEKDRQYLENERLYHLIFAAQLNYAQKFKGQVLVPSLFVCDELGFTEPNLFKMFSLGRPFMPVVKFSDPIEAFLESIWQKYGKLNLFEFTQLIKNSTAYKECFTEGEKHLINVNDILGKFKAAPVSKKENLRKKMLISQNGPVMVSQWNPRKIETNAMKGI